MDTLLYRNYFTAAALPLRGLALAQPESAAHRHEFTELVAITAGTGRHEAEGVSTPIARGMLVLVPAGTGHAYRDCRELELINILFDAAHLPLPLLDVVELPGFARLIEPESCRIWQPGESAFAPIERLARELTVEDLEKFPGSQCARFGLFLALLTRIARTLPGAARTPVPSGIGDAVARLRRTFARPPDLTALAARTGMSRSGFFAAFRRHTGVSPHAYVLQLRGERACGLLRETGLPVSEVAAAVGFPDSNTFCRAFRRLSGVSPREFRRAALEKSGKSGYSIESGEKAE